MKNILIAFLACVVAAAVAGVALAVRTGGSDAKPVLRLVDASPLTVRGLNFDPNERVSVSAHGSRAQRTARSLSAGSAGGFVVRFPDLDANNCSGFGVTAVGSNGDRASLGRRPGMCPPPPSEG
jgi:D-serine dehydratase